jgi:hypothetical protein
MVALLYIGLQTVTQGVLGAALANSQSPLVDAAGMILGTRGAQMLVLLTLVLAVAGTLVLYLICCLGVLRLRAKNVGVAGAPFVAPGGPIVPVAAAAIIVWLLSTLAVREMIAIVSFVVVAALCFYVRNATAKTLVINSGAGTR